MSFSPKWDVLSDFGVPGLREEGLDSGRESGTGSGEETGGNPSKRDCESDESAEEQQTLYESVFGVRDGKEVVLDGGYDSMEKTPPLDMCAGILTDIGDLVIDLRESESMGDDEEGEEGGDKGGDKGVVVRVKKVKKVKKKTPSEQMETPKKVKKENQDKATPRTRRKKKMWTRLELEDARNIFGIFYFLFFLMCEKT